jgi:hypothetical protein
MKRIILIAGFESFNADLYRQANAACLLSPVFLPVSAQAEDAN